MSELRDLLNDKGLSIKESAKILDVPYRTMQNWVNGYSAPAPYVYKLIMETLTNYKK